MQQGNNYQGGQQDYQAASGSQYGGNQYGNAQQYGGQQYGGQQPPYGGQQPPQGSNPYGQQQYGGAPKGDAGGYGAPPPSYAQQGRYGGAAPQPPTGGYQGSASPSSSDEDEYQKSIMAQWDEHMTDFEPADMLTINIPSRTDETFYEQITEVPSKVRGAYYIGSGEKKLIDFWIIDPSNRIFNSIQGKNEGLFVFEVQQPGLYQFVFSNSRYWEAKDLTFAIHFGNHTDDHASAEHLDPLQSSLEAALHDIKNLYSEVKFSVGRQDSHNTTVKNSMRTNFWISILETL